MITADALKDVDAGFSTGVPGGIPPTEAGTAMPEWPAPLAPAAYHGVIGDLVGLVEPHTESDPAALLLQALVIFGNMIGAGAYFVAEGSSHRPVLYLALVGVSAKGRKGSSLRTIRRVFELIDPLMADPMRVASGLSSGEGLIFRVRDPIVRGDATEDPGVADKRLLVLEEELASVLKTMSRDGNTLSALLRCLWDSGDAGTLTKSNPLKTTGACVSIIAHSTADELRRYLSQTELGNGFANRFLWVCARRSKVLPEGGALHTVDFGPIAERLDRAIIHGQHVGELRRSPEARALWASVYPDLSEGQPGLFGAVTSRAEAQVMRLALLYAVGDMSYVVRPEHLRAALEVWRYCADSARFVFGSSLGDPVADELDRALLTAGIEGMTRTEIRDYFGRNRASGDVARALVLLQTHGRIRVDVERNGTGRPTERWTHLRFTT